MGAQDPDWIATAGSYLAEPVWHIEPDRVDFGNVRIGDAPEARLIFENTGRAELELGQLVAPDPNETPFAVVEDTWSGRSLMPGERAELKVRMAPKEPGRFDGWIEVPLVYPLQETGRVALTGIAWPTASLARETVEAVPEGLLGADYARDVALTREGDLVVAGYLAGPSVPNTSDTTAWLKRYGSVTWEDTFEMGQVVPGLKDDSVDTLLGVAIDAEDNVIAVGRKSGAYFGGDYYHSVMLVRKYTPTGVLVWDQGSERIHRNGPWNEACDVVIDGHGNIVVGGTTFGAWSTVEHQWTMLKYSPEGVLVEGFPIYYNYSPSSSYPDNCGGVAVDAQDSIIVVGARGVAPNNRDWHVRKYDANGVLVWEDTYAGQAGLLDYAFKVAVDQDGNPIVAGYTNEGADNGSQADYDGLVIKYNGQDGQRLWSQPMRSHPPRNEAWYDVALDGLGNPLLVGYRLDDRGFMTGVMARLQGTDGTLLAEQVWTGEGDVGFYGVAYRNRTLAMAGFRFTGATRDRWLVKAVPPDLRFTEFVRLGENQWRIRWQGQFTPLDLLHSPSLANPNWQPMAESLLPPSWTGALPAHGLGFYRLKEPAP